MNTKRIIKPGPDTKVPQYLHAVDVDVTNRRGTVGHRLITGQPMSVRPGISRRSGTYVFRYAEWNETLGEHLLYVEGYGIAQVHSPDRHQKRDRESRMMLIACRDHVGCLLWIGRTHVCDI